MLGTRLHEAVEAAPRAQEILSLFERVDNLVKHWSLDDCSSGIRSVERFLDANIGVPLTKPITDLTRVAHAAVVGQPLAGPDGSNINREVILVAIVVEESNEQLSQGHVVLALKLSQILEEWLLKHVGFWMEVGLAALLQGWDDRWRHPGLEIVDGHQGEYIAGQGTVLGIVDVLVSSPTLDG